MESMEMLEREESPVQMSLLGRRINASLGIGRINPREVATTISKNNNQH